MKSLPQDWRTALSLDLSKQGLKIMKTKLLTVPEKKRIAQIERSMKYFKRDGADTTTWEAAFFLGIIRRLTGCKLSD